MSKKVLIVGCGQIGSRHLQAICCLPEILEIEVVDPSPQSLAVGQTRLEEVASRNPALTVRWLTDISQCSKEGDLCLVTTRAQGRFDLVQRIVEKLGYSSFLLEKIATQSIQEFKDLINYSRHHALKGWVHCQTRTYEVHRYIKSLLDPMEPIIFTEVAGNHGLACNGIHAADLFLFYDGTNQITLETSRLDDEVHPSKRGSGLMDVSGFLFGRSPKGSQLILSYDRHHRLSDVNTITTPRGRFIIDLNYPMAWGCSAGRSWQPIDVTENFLVSQTSKKLISLILRNEPCGLPTLEESLPAHEFILGALLPHFNRLCQREETSCPVT